MKLFGESYEVHLTVFTNGGNSSSKDHKIFYTHVFEKFHIFNIILRIIMPITITIIIFIIFIFYYFYRKAKLKRYDECFEYVKNQNQLESSDTNDNYDIKSKNMTLLVCSLFINDEMEIERNKIKLLEILGEGAFGLVRKGILLNDDGKEKEIAVKMLKDERTIEDFNEFQHEIKVMKEVGKHKNIVGIIGHCTLNIDEMMLLTEYCSNGNLLNYLRNEWKHLLNDYKNFKSNCNTPTPSPQVASWTIQKQPENVFNFDTSFVNKSFTYKNCVDNEQNDYNNDNDNNHKYLYTNNGIGTTNLIVNKLYDEFSQLNKINCTNSCKSNVKIISNCNNIKCPNYYENDLNYVKKTITKNCKNNENSLNIIDSKFKIEINDCDCNKRKSSSENDDDDDDNVDGEDDDVIGDDDDDKNDKKIESFVNDNNKFSIKKYRDDIIGKNLTNCENYINFRDLLSFANQIAHGMVSIKFFFYL